MPSEPSPPSFYDPNAVCEDCGRTGAFRFATATLCTDCYQQRGACCAEHAGNDLTCQDEKDGEEKRPPTAT
jgi:hypothetical protein